jgi:hypothetical protein
VTTVSSITAHVVALLDDSVSGLRGGLHASPVFSFHPAITRKSLLDWSQRFGREYVR